MVNQIEKVDDKQYNNFIINHYKSHWGNDFKIKRLSNGPIHTLPENFCILEYGPSIERMKWVYATCGMSSFKDVNPIELHIFSLTENENLLEILTAISSYHLDEAKLDLNQTVNFGVPWQTGSRCFYGLISLPYLDGPTLEIIKINHSLTVHFYWLIPITLAERNYKKTMGIEALEAKFEESHFNYLDPNRESVL